MYFSFEKGLLMADYNNTNIILNDLIEKWMWLLIMVRLRIGNE